MQRFRHIVDEIFNLYIVLISNSVSNKYKVY
jgi:hypothetical protein